MSANTFVNDTGVVCICAVLCWCPLAYPVSAAARFRAVESQQHAGTRAPPAGVSGR